MEEVEFEEVMCDNCNCLCDEDEVDRNGFCRDCQEAFEEEYGDDWESHLPSHQILFAAFAALGDSL